MTAKAKVTTVAKAPVHAKAAAATGTAKARTSAKAKASTKKHATTAKHAAKKTTAKKRGFAVGDLLPVCSLEAVAMSLRLAGQRVTDDDVAGLWELYGTVSIPQALAAVAGSGLAGCRPVFAQAAAQRASEPLRERAYDHSRDEGQRLGPREMHALILGVDTPGPHAVLATPDGWWSWGELWSPWPCRVEEAWAVSWS